MPLPKFNNCGLPTTRLMQKHLDPLTIKSKEVMETRRNRGVIIEPLEPDDSDEERQLKRKMCSKYKLRFVNKVCEAYHTRDPIKADDGSLLNVALFDENNRKITYGPLSSASVQIVVLHGDFNDHGQDYWTSEEFSRYEVYPRPGEEASSVLGGNCILVLADGEACLGDAFFKMTSYCARTGKFKMGVRLASAQEERIQGVSEPFWVKDRHFAVEEEPKQSKERLNDSRVVPLLASKKSNSKPWERTLVLLMAMLMGMLTAWLKHKGRVWQDTHYRRYLVFLYCSHVAFVLIVVILRLLYVLHKKFKENIWRRPQPVAMVLGLLSLVGAYAASTYRDAVMAAQGPDAARDVS